MSKCFPYFAGQKHKEKGITKEILSPYPIQTNFNDDYTARSILKKNYTYIDVGGRVFQGSNGVLFTTRMALGCVISLCLYWLMGGALPDIKREVIKDIYGADVVINADYSSLIIALIFILAPICMMGGIALSALIHDVKEARRMPPFRFHRQRREVAVSKWNKHTETFMVRYIPWEEVCAWVEEKDMEGATGEPATFTLFIGGGKSDTVDDFSGQFKSIRALNKKSAVMEWEAIRRFMEEGLTDDNELFDKPPKMTFRRVIDEHCAWSNISLSELSLSQLIWWNVNGTRLGVFFYNLTMTFEQKHAFRDPSFEAWSKPINENEWQKPSAALTKYNTWLKRNEYKKGLNILTLGDVKDKYSL